MTSVPATRNSKVCGAPLTGGWCHSQRLSHLTTFSQQARGLGSACNCFVVTSSVGCVTAFVLDIFFSGRDDLHLPPHPPQFTATTPHGSCASKLHAPAHETDPPLAGSPTGAWGPWAAGDLRGAGVAWKHGKRKKRCCSTARQTRHGASSRRSGSILLPCVERHATKCGLIGVRVPGCTPRQSRHSIGNAEAGNRSNPSRFHPPKNWLGAQPPSSPARHHGWPHT